MTAAGGTFDFTAALLQRQRPCASKIPYNIGADGAYRLDASASDCDERYKGCTGETVCKTKWKLEGTKFTTSSTNFAAGRSIPFLSRVIA